MARFVRIIALLLALAAPEPSGASPVGPRGGGKRPRGDAHLRGDSQRHRRENRPKIPALPKSEVPDEGFYDPPVWEPTEVQPAKAAEPPARTDAPSRAAAPAETGSGAGALDALRGAAKAVDASLGKGNSEDDSRLLGKAFGEKPGIKPGGEAPAARPLQNLLKWLRSQAAKGAELPTPDQLVEKAYFLTQDFGLKPERALQELGLFLLGATAVKRGDDSPAFREERLFFDGSELLLVDADGAMVRFDKKNGGWEPPPENEPFSTLKGHPELLAFLSRAPIVKDESFRTINGGLSEVWVEPGSGGFFKLAKPVMHESGRTHAQLLLEEAKRIVALEKIGVAGVPRLTKVGVNPDGTVWLDMRGIADAKSLASELFLLQKPDVRLAVLAQAARLLDGVHRMGIVHNDVKPRNIVVNREGEVMLIDFGISVAAGKKSRDGTKGYAAPEEVKRPHSDVYSFGATVKDIFVNDQSGIEEADLKTSGLHAFFTEAAHEDPSKRRPKDMEGVAKALEAARDYFRPGWLERREELKAALEKDSWRERYWKAQAARTDVVRQGRGIRVKKIVLHHGSATPGIKAFDFAAALNNDHAAWNLGKGVYLGADPVKAADYAAVRANQSGGTPTVYDFTISGLKLLDMRIDATLKKTFQGFGAHLMSKYAAPEARAALSPALRLLISDAKEDIDELNALPWGDIVVRRWRNEWISPWAGEFSAYVQSLGYAGLAAFEAVDVDPKTGRSAGAHDTWLIFDPAKAAITAERAVGK